MSIKWMSEVWENSKAEGTDLLLLLAIADYANKEGRAWPSQDSLAEKIRRSKRQVVTILKRLESSGELQIDRTGRSSQYQLVKPTSTVEAHFTSDVKPTSHQSGSPLQQIHHRTTIEPSIKDSSPTGLTISQQWVELIANVCSIDASLNGGRLAKRGMALQKAGYTLAQVEAGYSKGGWWYRSDWRGRQGQPPKPEDILATIKQATSESAFMPATEDGQLAPVAQPEQSGREIAFEDGRMIPMGAGR